jgi:hypothetical protein
MTKYRWVVFFFFPEFILFLIQVPFTKAQQRHYRQTEKGSWKMWEEYFLIAQSDKKGKNRNEEKTKDLIWSICHQWPDSAPATDWEGGKVFLNTRYNCLHWSSSWRGSWQGWPPQHFCTGIFQFWLSTKGFPTHS